MKHPRFAAALSLLIVSLCGFAKDKKKAPLPEDVLKAHTVLVIVDPSAGVDVQDPNANRLARTDVEQALMKWGRLMPVKDGFTADLIIMVRKGNGKMVQPTIGGTPVNGTPPVSIGSTTHTGRIHHSRGCSLGPFGHSQRPVECGLSTGHSSTPGRSWLNAGSIGCLSRRHQGRSRAGRHSMRPQSGAIPRRTRSSRLPSPPSRPFAKRSRIRRSNWHPLRDVSIFHISPRSLKGRRLHMNRPLKWAIDVRDGNQR